MEAIVTIKIPEEYVGELVNDRFRGTFERAKSDFNFWAGNYERETMDMLIEAFKNAEVLIGHEIVLEKRTDEKAVPSTGGNRRQPAATGGKIMT